MRIAPQWQVAESMARLSGGLEMWSGGLQLALGLTEGLGAWFMAVCICLA
jgi:hypothetical protein